MSTILAANARFRPNADGDGWEDVGEQGVNPTVQTKAKLRKDVIKRMFDEGEIPEPLFDSAEEIHAVAMALQRGLFSGARDYAKPMVQSSLRGAVGIERLSASEARIYSECYAPWSLATGRIVLRAGVTRLALIWDVVIDNAGLRQTDLRHGLRNGTTSSQLRAGLTDYALISGRIMPVKKSS